MTSAASPPLSPSDPAAPARKRRSRLFRIARAVAIAVAVVLALAGILALWLPGYLADVAVRQIREQLHREATIAKIGINPLTLSAHVEGFAVKDADGKSPLLSFESLRTRVGITSLLRGAPVIEALALDKPEIHLARLTPERYNISDIVDVLLAGPPNPKGPQFALSSLAVTDAVIVFDDRPIGKLHRIEKLSVKLPELSSFEGDRDEFAQPSLSAVVNGEPFSLSGRTKPFAESLETVVELKLEDFDIPRYLGYSPVALPLRIDKGALSTALQITLVRAKDKQLKVSVTGNVAVDDLLLRDPRTSDAAPNGVNLAAVKRIEAAIGKFEWPANTLAMDRVAVVAPQILVRRQKDGTLDWQTIVAGTPGMPATASTPAPAAPAPPTAATPPTVATPPTAATVAAAASPAAPSATPPESTFRFAIADAQIRDGLVLVEDAAAPGGSVRIVASPIAVHARNVSNAAGAEASVEASLVTDGGERVTQQGTLSLQPLAAKGRISAANLRLQRYRSYLADVLDGDVDGTVEAEAAYTLAPGGAFTLADGRVGAADLVLRDRKRAELARIPSLAVAGIGLDVGRQSVSIASAAVKSCRAAIVRNRNGDLDILSVVRSTSPAPSATAPKGAAGPSESVVAQTSTAASGVDGPGGKSRARSPGATVASPRSASPPPASAGWSLAVAQATLERCALKFDDRATTADEPARLNVEPLDVRVENWSLAPDNRARVDLRATINRRGQLAVKGIAGGTPLAANVDVALKGLDLVPFQPYVADQLNVRVTSGVLGTRGKLALTQGAATAIRFRGEASVANLASTTKADNEDFLNWSMLEAKGLDVAVNAASAAGGGAASSATPARSPTAAGGAAVAGGAAPIGVALDEVALSGFYSRLIVNADGTLNVQHIVRGADADRAVSAEAAAGRTEAPGKSIVAQGGAPAPQAAPAAPAPITIGRVTLASGHINFSDHFIKPNYSADINDVNGTIAGLSSDPSARATVDVQGRYDPSAPVEIKGTINPLSGNLFLDIAASCRDVELVQFTPYAQKYAGYGITKGKLMLNVKYLIDNRKLTADNTLVLQQLTFGERVESPDATKLPVLLAVSLLKDVHGNIDLNLPISGSLDDPQFSVFGIVVKIIVNLLVKAATSPFALIAAIAGGGGEDLAFVDFPAGGATVPSAVREDKLAKIAKALAERPGLSLDIAGRVDPAADRAALQRRGLMRKLAGERQPDVSAAQGDAASAAESITIPPDEFATLLKRVYDREIAKPRPAGGAASAGSGAVAGAGAAPQNAAAPPRGTPPARAAAAATVGATPDSPEVPAAEMERVLLAAIPVTDDDLAELAERRAYAARNALGALGVGPERMFVVAAKPGTDAKAAPRVDFTLK